MQNVCGTTKGDATSGTKKTKEETVPSYSMCLLVWEVLCRVPGIWGRGKMILGTGRDRKGTEGQGKGGRETDSFYRARCRREVISRREREEREHAKEAHWLDSALRQGRRSVGRLRLAMRGNPGFSAGVGQVGQRGKTKGRQGPIDGVRQREERRKIKGEKRNKDGK